MSEWETVVGLEVHCELATQTKLFCGCANLFGDEPNTNICPVCLGLPGSLPVLNETAVELAVRLGRALHCTVVRSVFARKNYFYPDMPKDYQISQYDLPTNIDGYLDLPSGKRIGIERAHIEEDTGKNTHVGGGGRIHGAEYSLVDYNRSGIPLVEIVSRPDLRGPEEAQEYVRELRDILLATGASDAKMEEGSMRVDANVSVRRVGDPEFGTRCEIKNLNSVRSLGRGIEFEVVRQIELISGGGRVKQETRHWDEDAGRTRPGRSKEQAEDYRYFPEPDLVPLEPQSLSFLDEPLPELPADLRRELAAAAGLEPTDPAVRAAFDRGMTKVALAAIAADAVVPRVFVHIENNIGPDDEIDPAAFAKLTQLEASGALTATQAKTVLAELVEHGGDPEAIAKAKGFEAMDTAALDAAIAEVIAGHPDEWAKFLAGDEKVAQFLTGQVMRATKGKADGKAVGAVFQERRAAAGE